MSIRPIWFLLLAVCFLAASCGIDARPRTSEDLHGYKERGKATYYADKFQNRPTASGEPYDQNKLTAAHPSLPFGTRVRVTNLANGRTVIVRINDRFPGQKGRIIDLSRSAFEKISPLASGVVEVEVETVE